MNIVCLTIKYYYVDITQVICKHNSFKLKWIKVSGRKQSIKLAVNNKTVDCDSFIFG